MLLSSIVQPPNGWTVTVCLLFFASFVIFLLWCRFFFFFVLLLRPRVYLLYQYAFNSTAPVRTAAVAVPLNTHVCCCGCTYRLQYSPPWVLLLLLFIVHTYLPRRVVPLTYLSSRSCIFMSTCLTFSSFT